MTHICVSRLTITGSDNGLSPGWRQAIIWTNAGMLLIGPLGTNFSDNLIEILAFSFKKMRLKVLSAKWRPFCLHLNVLNYLKCSAILQWNILNEAALIYWHEFTNQCSLVADSKSLSTWRLWALSTTLIALIRHTSNTDEVISNKRMGFLLLQLWLVKPGRLALFVLSFDSLHYIFVIILLYKEESRKRLWNMVVHSTSCKNKLFQGKIYREE